MSGSKTVVQYEELLEGMLRSLLKGPHSSLTLGFNEASAPNYLSVKGMEESLPKEARTDWISEEERQRGFELNSCWTLCWYPDNPIGLCLISASSLPALIAHVAENYAEDAA